MILGSEMKQLKTIVGAAALAAAVAAPAQAEQFWADNSITLLHSADYFNVPYNFGAPNKNIEMTTMTLEHASGHSWGDAFFFLDRHHGKGSASGFTETYSEVSPRISLGKTTGSDLSIGPLKDVLIATTYEFSNDTTGFSQDNYLYGVGLDWELPGFAFFQTNFYYANNKQNFANFNDDWNDLQLTVAYGVPFQLIGLDMMFDGYLDWSSAETTNGQQHAADFHFNPQLRADVGKFMGITKSKLEVGLEYSYWHNKFGVASDESESAVSGLIKYHL
jgi:nucleoside-specific outer membrane channel protein Tsx